MSHWCSQLNNRTSKRSEKASNGGARRGFGVIMGKNTRGRHWGPGKKERYEITRRKRTCPQLLSQELGDNPAMSEKSTRVLMKSSKSLMRRKKNEKPKTATALLHAEFYASLLLPSSIFPPVTGRSIRTDVCHLNALIRARAQQICHTDDVI